jgi:hypothetical protein
VFWMPVQVFKAFSDLVFSFIEFWRIIKSRYFICTLPTYFTGCKTCLGFIGAFYEIPALPLDCRTVTDIRQHVLQNKMYLVLRNIWYFVSKIKIYSSISLSDIIKCCIMQGSVVKYMGTRVFLFLSSEDLLVT